jgi:hypothetical protein|tara:strand:+ start:119 stop:337 length:219 start_codon:yes stop_codon:yes gene_type:complete
MCEPWLLRCHSTAVDPTQPAINDKNNANPVVRAPNRVSQQAIQAPLKPVCPVSKTLRSDQKSGFGVMMAAIL